VSSATGAGIDAVRTRSSGRTGQGFRADIEGMRALAVLLVVIFHAGVPQLAGGFVGVDIFFVISGFLITGLLVDEARRTGSINIPNFYARRVRRLLPMATLVLVATTVVFRLVLPPLDWANLGTAVAAATFWVANWHFAAEQTDYMGDADHSPVLHYWSLSVEEQFYVVWPLLLLTVLWLHRRTGKGDITRWFAVALAVLGGGSLALSILTTRDSGPWAYFGLHTRAWELAAGAALALGRPMAARIPRTAALLAGWGGLLLVLGSAFLLDRATTFPGVAALWPVAGVMMLIAAGARTQSGVGSLLSWPVLTYLGRVSYGWYLWHWPCLRLAAEIDSGPQRTAEAVNGQGTGSSPWTIGSAVLISLLLAILTNHLVEQPVRRWTALLRSSGRSLALGACLLLTAVSGASIVLGSPIQVMDQKTAEVLRQTPEEARKDNQTPVRCFVPFGSVDADPNCRFGDPNGQKVVVLFGDSHAAQWFPALEEAAQEQHWQLYLWAKSGCGYAEARQWLANYRREYGECATWRESALQRIEGLPRVDAVVIGRNVYQLTKLVDQNGAKADEKAAVGLWAEGADRVFRRLRARSRQVILMRDTPRPLDDLPACVSENLGDPQRCDFPRKGHADLDGKLFSTEQTAVTANGVHVLRTTPLVCPQNSCPALSQAGNLTFKDDNHLTGSYSRELGDALAVQLFPSPAPSFAGVPPDDLH
jgi:peptidoglycan/LPS O-acetylase OafA/YrhL